MKSIFEFSVGSMIFHQSVVLHVFPRLIGFQLTCKTRSTLVVFNAILFNFSACYILIYFVWKIGNTFRSLSTALKKTVVVLWGFGRGLLSPSASFITDLIDTAVGFAPFLSPCAFQLQHVRIFTTTCNMLSHFDENLIVSTSYINSKFCSPSVLFLWVVTGYLYSIHQLVVIMFHYGFMNTRKA